MVYPVWVKKKKRRDYKVGVAGAGRRYMGSLARLRGGYAE
jgi:hypothetical protein